jgi:hypothetical protein
MVLERRSSVLMRFRKSASPIQLPTSLASHAERHRHAMVADAGLFDAATCLGVLEKMPRKPNRVYLLCVVNRFHDVTPSTQI